MAQDAQGTVSFESLRKLASTLPDSQANTGSEVVPQPTPSPTPTAATGSAGTLSLEGLRELASTLPDDSSAVALPMDANPVDLIYQRRRNDPTADISDIEQLIRRQHEAEGGVLSRGASAALDVAKGVATGALPAIYETGKEVVRGARYLTGTPQRLVSSAVEGIFQGSTDPIVEEAKRTSSTQLAALNALGQGGINLGQAAGDVAADIALERSPEKDIGLAINAANRRIEADKAVTGESSLIPLVEVDPAYVDPEAAQGIRTVAELAIPMPKVGVAARALSRTAAGGRLLRAGERIGALGERLRTPATNLSPGLESHITALAGRRLAQSMGLPGSAGYSAGAAANNAVLQSTGVGPLTLARRAAAVPVEALGEGAQAAGRVVAGPEFAAATTTLPRAASQIDDLVTRVRSADEVLASIRDQPISRVQGVRGPTPVPNWTEAAREAEAARAALGGAVEAFESGAAPAGRYLPSSVYNAFDTAESLLRTGAPRAALEVALTSPEAIASGNYEDIGASLGVGALAGAVNPTTLSRVLNAERPLATIPEVRRPVSDYRSVLDRPGQIVDPNTPLRVATEASIPVDPNAWTPPVPESTTLRVAPETPLPVDPNFPTRAASQPAPRAQVQATSAPTTPNISPTSDPSSPGAPWRQDITGDPTVVPSPLEASRSIQRLDPTRRSHIFAPEGGELTLREGYILGKGSKGVSYLKPDPRYPSNPADVAALERYRTLVEAPWEANKASELPPPANTSSPIPVQRVDRALLKQLTDAGIEPFKANYILTQIQEGTPSGRRVWRANQILNSSWPEAPGRFPNREILGPPGSKEYNFRFTNLSQRR